MDQAWKSIIQYLFLEPEWALSQYLMHEAEGRIGYWLRGHEGDRNNCFSKIQPVEQKYRE